MSDEVMEKEEEQRLNMDLSTWVVAYSACCSRSTGKSRRRVVSGLPNPYLIAVGRLMNCLHPEKLGLPKGRSRRKRFAVNREFLPREWRAVGLDETLDDQELSFEWLQCLDLHVDAYGILREGFRPPLPNTNEESDLARYECL